MFTDLIPIHKDGTVSDITAALSRSASTLARQTFLHDDAVRERQKAKQLSDTLAGMEANKDLLASPTKLDNMVVAGTTDIYPHTKRPDFKGAEVRTDAVDKAMGDHPLAGSTTAIKEKFKQALADPRYATVSHAQMLDAIKKDHLVQVGPDGKSLLEKSHEYKFNKDNGPFRFFSDAGDKNTVALPGYDKYKETQPHESSALEAITLNAGLAAALGVGATVATGGLAALPTAAAAIAGRVLFSAAVAVPEFRVMEAAERQVSKNPDGSEDWVGKLAVGLGALALTHKVTKFGTGKVLEQAMKSEKLGGLAAAAAGFTGTATKALEAFNAGKVAAADLARAEAVAAGEKIALRETQKKGILNSADVINPEESSSALNAIKGVDNTVTPEAAHLLGMSEDTYKTVGNKPSILFTHLSPEGEDAVYKAIQTGTPTDIAIIQQFNKEAALAKLARIEAGASELEISAEARKALRIPTFSETMVGTAKSSTSSKVGGKIDKVPSAIAASGVKRTEPTIQELITGDNFVSEASIPTAGVNTKAVTPKPVLYNQPVQIETPVSTGIIVQTGNVIPAKPLEWVKPKIETNFGTEPPKVDTSVAGKTIFGSKGTIYGISVGVAGTAALASGNSDGTALAEDSISKINNLTTFDKIINFLTPGTVAHAGVLNETVMVIPKVVGETLAGATGQKVEKLVSEAIEKGYARSPIAAGQVHVNPLINQVPTAPALGRTYEAYNKSVKTQSTFMDKLVGSLNSPYFISSVYQETEHKLATQMANASAAIAFDSEQGLRAAQHILDPVLGKANNSRAIAEHWKPVQDAHDAVVFPLRTIELETIKAQDVIKKLEETLGAGSDDATIAARIAEEKDKLKILTGEYSKYTKEYPTVKAQYDEAMDYSIRTWPESRISFAVENPALMRDAKYAELYTDSERAAVQQLRDLNLQYKGFADKAGLETLDTEFMHISRDQTKHKEMYAESLRKLGVYTNPDNIPLTEFLSRSKYAKQMIPDARRNMFEYVPDAVRRIHVANLWQKGSENGWHAFSQNELVKGNKVLNDYFERMKQAFAPVEQTGINKLINRYTSLETLRLLFATPSAAFKHLFKNEGTWATFGMLQSISHTADAAIIASKNGVANSLTKLGLADKIGPRSNIELFVNSVTKQRSMLNVMDGLEKDPAIGSKFDEWLQKLNSAGGVGIQVVENFDRAHTVLNAMSMAAKKGMTAEQAMTSLYDSILRNNFLGGALNPEWMKNPKVRALMLFQGTPFKIMERRLINAMALGHDVKTAYGVIRNQDVQKNLEELQSIGKYMLGAQTEFKQHMIYDALTGSKDVYGNSLSAQFVREAVIVGGVIAGGGAMGMDFHKHSLHVPFLKEGSAPELSVNPITTAAYKTTFGTVGQDDKTFFPARFLQNYLTTTGGTKEQPLKGLQPLMFHKMQRLSANDIPAIYKDSAFKYLFSVPSSK